MTSAPPPPAATPESVTLSPHYGVALGMVGLGMACLLLQPLWGGAPLLALGISVLGLFLLLQTVLLRLEFTADALLVRRQDALLRRFPYDDWLGWTLFWPGLPVLFYFREQRSIHLLPVLFQSATLRSQLHLHLPHLAANDDGPTHS
jgi:hypothetical protein